MNLLTLQRIKEDTAIIEARREREESDHWLNGVNISDYAYRVHELVHAYEDAHMRMREARGDLYMATGGKVGDKPKEIDWSEHPEWSF